MIDTIIFDLGGVLINWQPRSIYTDYFETEAELDYFFDHVCTMEWNEKQDEDRSLREGTESKVAEFPSFEEPIRMYYDRWKDMIIGQFDETVAVLEMLHKKKEYRLLALTNWSAETFPYPLQKFEFLSWFEGIVVSGEEKVCKPDERIYRILLERYKVDAAKSVFIDDNKRNVEAAVDVGMNGIHFERAGKLVAQLSLYGIL